jgi:glycosyltransferase involved in cell wall biosynthesis
MVNAEKVFAGNSFLAEKAKKYNSNVVIVPTAVDTVRFSPRYSQRAGSEIVVFGWIGTSGNFHYLYALESVLKRFFCNNRKAKLLVMADKMPIFKELPSDSILFRRWSTGDEIDFFSNIDVGIMPLIDSEIARGKCSFKLLQYMACGLPVIASPVGMNVELLSQDEIGLSAARDYDWIDAMELLARDAQLRESMGRNGRRVVESSFSVDVVGALIADNIKSVC